MPSLPDDCLPPPAWVRWIAQDADGAWWGYSVEPLQHDTGWYENEVGRCLALGRGEPNPDWRETLQGVPEQPSNG